MVKNFEISPKSDSENKNQSNFTHKHHRQSRSPLIVSVSSGKGGVGKTLTICQLALSAANLGNKVLILDGDMGMSNVDVVLGLHARYNIHDVLEGHIKLSEVILKGPNGIDVISSGSGIFTVQRLSYVQKQIILEEFIQLDKIYDVILIDTGAGIGENVLHFNEMANIRIIVTTSEPHALTDAYATIKVLNEEKKIKNFNLIVNMTRHTSEGQQVSDRLDRVAREFLGVEINYLGCVPADPSLLRAIVRQKVISEQSLQTISGQSWNRIGHKIFRNCINHQSTPSYNWSRLMALPK